MLSIVFKGYDPDCRCKACRYVFSTGGRDAVPVQPRHQHEALCLRRIRRDAKDMAVFLAREMDR